MSAQASEFAAAPEYYRPGNDERGGLAERAAHFVSNPAGFAIAGLAVGALAVAVGMYVAPDLKRYLKMRSM